MSPWSRAALVTLLTVLASGCIYVTPHDHGKRRPKSVVVHPSPVVQPEVVVVKKAKRPKHGHKHRHGGIELVFDEKLGVYLVVGRSDHYYHGTRFFRLTQAGWQVSAHIDAGWVSIRYEEVPSRLLVLQQHHKHHKRHKGHKGRHPAKHDW